MRVIILAGGLGTRLREETEYKPKPMVEVGGKPILWHLMKILNSSGITDFVIALGYKGNVIRDYFVNFDLRGQDIEIDLTTNMVNILKNRSKENWRVTLVETGPNTPTGGRIANAREYLDGERFLCAYGDGLADIDVSELIKFHVAHGKIATVTAASPVSRFGKLKIDENNLVKSFVEKPDNDSVVNAGFFIFEPKIFNYLNSESTLEREVLEKLVEEEELMAFRHKGFWQPMDTLREAEILNNLWDSSNPPWKVWSD